MKSLYLLSLQLSSLSILSFPLSSFLWLVTLCKSYNHTIHHRIKSKFNRQYFIKILKQLVFVVVGLLSFYQLPLFSDLTSSPSSPWNAILPLFGFHKWMSYKHEGMAMCLGDGISHSRTEVIECTYYSNFAAMGCYAMLLLVIIVYVGWLIVWMNDHGLGICYSQ